MLNSRNDVNICANDGKGNIILRGRAKIDDLSSPVIDGLRQDVQEIKNTIRAVNTNTNGGGGALHQQIFNARLNTIEETVRTLDAKINDFISKIDERLTAFENSFAEVDSNSSVTTTSDSNVSDVTAASTEVNIPKTIVLRRVPGNASNKIVRYAW
jgi:hypothetical protein